MRYKSIEGAVRGYIRSLLPEDNISDWFSFEETSFNLQGFNIQIRKTGNKFPAFYSIDTIANFELSASYNGECYKVYAIPIAIGRF